MRETAHYLAVGAVCVMHTIDPDLVLFGGGMIAAGLAFLDDIRRDIRAMAFPVPAARTRVEYAGSAATPGLSGPRAVRGEPTVPSRRDGVGVRKSSEKGRQPAA